MGRDFRHLLEVLGLGLRGLGVLRPYTLNPQMRARPSYVGGKNRGF